MQNEYTQGELAAESGLDVNTTKRYLYRSDILELLTPAVLISTKRKGRPYRVFSERDLALLKIVRELHDCRAVIPSTVGPLLRFLAAHPDLGANLAALLREDAPESVNDDDRSYLHRVESAQPPRSLPTEPSDALPATISFGVPAVPVATAPDV